MSDFSALNPIWQALIQSVSKTGDFELAEQELDLLSGTLSDQDALSLYEAIRDHSMRLEEEWRDHFIEAFSSSEHLLPPSQT